ncbi:MazG family protein [Prochlorococcus marinus str. MIT 9515]|uniref:MazG family protein n=1 Tax=Prochlorococcus marinus (strain MIT 9515) TaxID=167542 RepID=A2BZ71_PROM5|nr:nucleoside triphosphate pyrophosphohydrolase [Prochlorococcus marinus]ABM73082.1 MazG family protein [Prochlorococcus marinus str. MIT 9515]
MTPNNCNNNQNDRNLKALENFKILISNIKLLKDKTWGCPWQKKQSHETLIPFLNEESNEFIDAVYEKNANNMCEELGDLLLQILLHAEIGFEENQFELNDIIKNLNKKIINRHPYIFKKQEKVSLKKSQEIWRNIKNSEKKDHNKESSISKQLNSEIRSLPATVGSEKITNTVKKYGFKWVSSNQIFDKLSEEICELKEAIQSKNSSDIQDEFGDVYFTLINLSNFLKINPESSLQKTNKKFLKRFSIIEDLAGDNIKKQTLKEFKRLWKVAKKTLFIENLKNK